MAGVDADTLTRTTLITDLFTAVTEGNLFSAENILGNNFPKQTFKNISSTLLHQAANNRHAALLKLLGEFGAFVDSKNAQQMTALHVSANKGDIKSLQTLLEYNANINAVDYDQRTPLYLAAYDGHLKCVETLLNHEKIDITIHRKGGWTHLHEAARFGHLLCMELLINAGANITARTDDAWWQPGHMAASCGNLSCLGLLVEHGIDINAGAGPNHTSTLLHEAAHAGHHECVQLLLDSGADATLYDGRHLPHHLACQLGHAKCLDIILTHLHERKKSFLVDAFTNVDPTTNALTYNNAFHMAALYGHENCIDILIKHDAKHLPNGMGVYPAMMASSKMHVKCLKVILKDNKKRAQKDEKFLETQGSETALHHLCMKTFKTNDKIISCACILLNSGIIDVNQHDELWDVSPCLYLAARNGAIGLVQYLLNSGAIPRLCQRLTKRMRITNNVNQCAELMEEMQEEPKTLLLCCRLYIRQLLSSSTSSGVGRIYEIPLPRFLQNYIFHGHYRCNGSCDVDIENEE